MKVEILKNIQYSADGYTSSMAYVGTILDMPEKQAQGLIKENLAKAVEVQKKSKKVEKKPYEPAQDKRLDLSEREEK